MLEGGVSGEGDGTIQISVRSEDGHEVHFRVRSTTQMQKVMRAYCERVGSSLDAVRFLFDGERVRGHQTVGVLALVSGDTIDAMVEQVGA
ncbi:ubiquitin-like protein [Streptomyces collinus]|uniref:ubiquitin-like protein n=1 Tax=Streptomyces collinus TaxID=42684 RepID=UPI0033A56968